MTLFVSMTDVAEVLRTTRADLRAARRLFRPPLHVIRPRAGAAGRGPDLLGLDSLLVWLDAAMGGGLDARVASGLARRARTEQEFDGQGPERS